MTPAEIAAELRVNPATVRLWASKGQLKATRAGMRKLLIRRSDLQELLAAMNPTDLEPSGSTDQPRPDSREPSARASGPSQAAGYAGARDLFVQASARMDQALIVSALAAPSDGYLDRIRAIADAFEHLGATALNGARSGGTWNGRADFGHERLPYELRLGGNRPKLAGGWERFDAAIERLAVTMKDHDLAAVGNGFHEVADELLAVIAALEDESDSARTRAHGT